MAITGSYVKDLLLQRVSWSPECRKLDYCLWHGLSRLCYHLAVRRMARVLLPLAWAISSWLLYGCTPNGVSIIAFGLGYLTFVIVWMYAAWREYYCLWPGLSHLWYRTAVRRKAHVLLPLAWPVSSFLFLWMYAVWCKKRS